MSKTDKDLGRKIHAHLLAKGVETPITKNVHFPAETKLNTIERNIREIMDVLGLDLSDDSLVDTPKRVAKMYVNEICSGLDYDNFPKCTAVENKMHYDEMVVEKDVKCISLCEHHLITIDQSATIAYIPKTTVLGLSKLNRIAKFFAQRPQIQERFVEQVFHALEFILETEDIAIVVSGKHYCVAARGVEDTSSYTITSKLGGAFKTDQALRKEFFDLVNSKK